MIFQDQQILSKTIINLNWGNQIKTLPLEESRENNSSLLRQNEQADRSMIAHE